jgi:MYND finger
MDYDDPEYLKGWGFDSNVCNLCGKKNSEVSGLLMQCGRCKKVYYCSRQCFNDGLADHNLICSTIDKMSRDPALSKDPTPPMPLPESKSKEVYDVVHVKKAKARNKTKLDEPSSIPSKVNEGLLDSDQSKHTAKNIKHSKKARKKDIPENSSKQNSTDEEANKTNFQCNDVSKKVKKQKKTSPHNTLDIPQSDKIETPNDKQIKNNKLNVKDKPKKKASKERSSSIVSNPIDDIADENKQDNNKHTQPSPENSLCYNLSGKVDVPDDAKTKCDKSMETEKPKMKTKKERTSSILSEPVDDIADERSGKQDNNRQKKVSSESALNNPIIQKVDVDDDEPIQNDKSSGKDKKGEEDICHQRSNG